MVAHERDSHSSVKGSRESFESLLFRSPNDTRRRAPSAPLQNPALLLRKPDRAGSARNIPRLHREKEFSYRDLLYPCPNTQDCAGRTWPFSSRYCRSASLQSAISPTICAVLRLSKTV